MSKTSSSGSSNSSSATLKEHEPTISDEGKLIAVSMIDLLPSCVNSSYFIWDPDYKYLRLGIVSALFEIEWVRSLST